MSDSNKSDSDKSDSLTPHSSTDTIIDASAKLSHDLLYGAKDRANELVHLPIMVLKFLAHPFRFISNAPDLKTPSWVILTISAGVLGSIVNAVIGQSYLRLFLALLALPLGSFLSVFATTSLLKIVLRGAHGLKFRYRSGASIFAFANLFWWIPIGAADKFLPISLIGFSAALIIAGYGFTTKLALPKKPVIFWFSALALAHILLWSLGNYITAK